MELLAQLHILTGSLRTSLRGAMKSNVGIVCIDGRDGAGKSTIARYLALMEDMCLIETDVFLLNNGTLDYHRCLREFLDRQIEKKGRTIVEGVFSQRLLKEYCITPFFTIRAIRVGNEGSNGTSDWSVEFKAYESEYNSDSVINIPCRELAGSNFSCNLLGQSSGHRCNFCPSSSKPSESPWHE